MTDTAATNGLKINPGFWNGLGGALKHPLVLLLIGTALGSWLIPGINERSNQKTAKHEQRIKMALSIIEQDHETDKKISGMMNYLLLFRQNLQVPGMTTSSVKKEQYTAREKMGDMYLDFNAQAWHWYSDVQSETQLSALATPEESSKVASLASQYGTELNKETANSVSSLWDGFLKNDFRPSDAKYDLLTRQAQQAETDGNNARNNIAIQMAIILASEDEK